MKKYELTTRNYPAQMHEKDDYTRINLLYVLERSAE